MSAPMAEAEIVVWSNPVAGILGYLQSAVDAANWVTKFHIVLVLMPLSFVPAT